MTGTFIAREPAAACPAPALCGDRVAAALLPLVWRDPTCCKRSPTPGSMALLALSLTLVAGTVGQISLGHAALLAIGGYASALLALDLGWPVWAQHPRGGLIDGGARHAAGLSGASACAAITSSIATLGIGEIVGLVILNWDGLTRGPIGLSGIPPLSAFGPIELDTPVRSTGYAGRRAGRCWRCCRRGCSAPISAAPCARSATTRWPRAPTASRLDRYKALAFAFGGFAAGIAGAITAHLYSYINHETFDAQLSILALTMVILGRHGQRARRGRWARSC